MKKSFKHNGYFSKLTLMVLFCVAPFCLKSQWLEIDGLPGGKILSVCKGESSVFATSYDGLWRSTDGGEHWAKVPLMDSRCFVSTDGLNAVASFDANLPFPFYRKSFQSTDDGATWTEVTMNPNDSLYAPEQVFGHYAYTRKAGSLYGVYRTGDFGATWEFVSPEALFTFIPDAGKMYRSNEKALLESSDGGSSWDTLSVFPNYVQLRIKKGDKILLSSTLFQIGDFLYLSEDNGATWKTMPIPSEGDHPYDIFALHQGKLYAFRKFSSYAVVADLSTGVFEDLNLPERSRTGLGVVSTGEKLLRPIYYNGVSLSNDGTSWHKVQGINTSGKLQAFDGNLYATPGMGFYRLKPDKQHWELIAPDFELRQIQSFAVEGDYITLVSSSGQVLVSSDGGQTFEPGKNEDGSPAYGNYRMEEAGGQLFGWDYIGLRILQPQYSDNQGLNWKSLSSSIGSLYPTTLAVSNGHLYLCDTLNLLYRWDASAQTFEQISTTPIPFAGSNRPKFTIFVKGDTYIVDEPTGDFTQDTLEARYFVSTDAGQSWTEHLLPLWIIECSADTIFATGLGLQAGISTDQADTWQPFSEGMEGNATWLEIFEEEVFASTENKIYRRKTNGELPTVPAAEPADFSGLTAFPNPFSDHFSVQFAKIKSVTTARLYDMLGKQIVLPGEPFSDAEILFSGLGHLPRGVYFLEIESGGSRSVEKLMKI
ncbi:MAG: T9SS type A sorting domain-containing protein [Phycisphaerae bacterium]|nr:T9SS type A sorting domain-containing protein [Saprospiraceae bacterium]